MVHLAECYELTNKKDEAIKWYTKVKDLVNIPDAKTYLQKNQRTKEIIFLITKIIGHALW